MALHHRLLREASRAAGTAVRPISRMSPYMSGKDSGVARIFPRGRPTFMGAPGQPLPKIENSSALVHYFLGRGPKSRTRKKKKRKISD